VSIVFLRQNFVPRVTKFPSNEGVKVGYPLRNRYFTAINTSSVRPVADRDRHRLAAYQALLTIELSRGTNIDNLKRP